MRLGLLTIACALGACAEREPVRPVTPILDPASTVAIEARYESPPNPLSSPPVGGGGGGDADDTGATPSGTSSGRGPHR